MPAKKSAKKQSPRVMDVSKPGKSTPSASSRPVIVGHRPAVQDPMVNENKPEKPSGEAAGQKIDVKRTAPKVIAPISTPEDLAKAAEAKAAPSAPEPEATLEPPVEETPAEEAPSTDDQSAPEPEEPAEEAPEIPEAPEETPSPADDQAPEISEYTAADSEASTQEAKSQKQKATSSKDKGSSVVDALASQASKDKPKKDAQADEQLQKRLDEVEKLVDDKKYYVHTSQTTGKQRRTRWFALILVVLLLAGGYLALDAQVIKNDIQLPYEFFEEAEHVEPSANNTPPTTPVTTDTTTQPEEPVQDAEALTWKEVTSKQKAFSLRIPDGWQVANYGGSDNIRGQGLDYKKGQPATIEDMATPYAGDSIFRLNIMRFEKGEPQATLDGDEKKETFKTSTLEGTRYYKKYPVKEPEGLGPYPGMESYTYEFKKDGATVYVTYNIFNDNQYIRQILSPSVFSKADKNQVELIERMVKTLVIK
jgi:hypothetical protein